jgi:hypothetical protein
MFNTPMGPSMQDLNRIRHDTRAWCAQVWISAAAATMCAGGLAALPGSDLDAHEAGAPA